MGLVGKGLSPSWRHYVYPHFTAWKSSSHCSPDEVLNYNMFEQPENVDVKIPSDKTLMGFCGPDCKGWKCCDIHSL